MNQTPACPVDGTPLEAAVREEVELRTCPQCRGIWIDRAELDKIVAKGAGDRRAVRSADPTPNAAAERPGFGGVYGSPGDQPHLRRRPSLVQALFGDPEEA